MKHILQSNRHYILHKRYQYNIEQLRMILQINKLIKIKADTSKAIMIINKNTLKKEIDNFMQENNIKQKKYVPTCTKIIQQKLQKCNSVADKRPNKY